MALSFLLYGRVVAFLEVGQTTQLCRRLNSCVNCRSPLPSEPFADHRAGSESLLSEPRTVLKARGRDPFKL